MEDSPSFSLGITQEFEDIVGSLAKARDINERRSKVQNDPIPFRISLINKRKADKVTISSGDSEEVEVDDSDQPEEQDIEEGNEVFLFF